MSSIDVFRRIFVAQSAIEEPIKLLLQQYYPSFIKEIESQQSLPIGKISPPLERNYTSRNKFDALAGDDIPKVVVISPGLIGTPKMSGNGQIRATWRLGIGVATAATDEETAKLHCDIYGAAARDIMLKLGGGVLNGHVEWLDEQYVDLPISDQVMQYRAASIWFSVDIENVATKRGGPELPNAEPYGYHRADSVTIVKIKEPISG